MKKIVKTMINAFCGLFDLRIIRKSRSPHGKNHMPIKGEVTEKFEHIKYEKKCL